MNSQHLPSAIGVSGFIGAITLGNLNTLVAILVGLATLGYLGIKIYKELKCDAKDCPRKK